MAVVINGTTGVSGVDGSAGTPSYQGADSNTGIFFPAADTIAFAEGGAEAMRIDSSGNVGIGTTAPNTTLSIVGNHTSGQGTLKIQTVTSFASGGLSSIALDDSDGTRKGFIYQDSGGLKIETAASLPVLFYPGGNERARITSGGFFKATNSGSYVDTSGTYHEMSTNDSGDVITIFRHTATSNPYGIYIDFTGADPNNATNYMFRAEISGVGNVYSIWSNGTTTARSDAKWKKNIETARDGYVDDLARLRVVKYNWYNHEDGTPKELGLIAQEVEQVFPGLVQTEEQTQNETRTREIPAVLDEDGNEVEPARTEEYTEKVHTGEYTKSVKFSVFTPMLIKAVQELKAITDAQATRIEALEAEVAAMKGAN